jgi:hypothetical protein
MALVETPFSAAVKETIAGTFGLAGKVVEAAGNAVRGVGEAVGGAMQGALSPAPVTVINGVGMAGQAAKTKVSGSGTIPTSPKKSGRPAVNPNMPTEKLLVVAVNYLSSIEKTLEQQLQFERKAFQQQAQAEKEASIESGGRSIQNPFSNLGEKLGAVKDNAKERAGTVGKLLIAGGLLGALGLGAIGNLDTSQLNELKSNWAAFTDKISPVIDFVKNLAGALGYDATLGAGIGFTVAGVRGALIGAVAGKIYEDAYGKINKETNQREGGKGLLSAIVGNFPLAALAIAPVTAVKFAYKGVKAAAGAVTGFVARQAARFSAWFAEKAFIRFAFSAYGKNRLWNLFLRYLEKKAQQRLLAQIAAVGATAAATTAAEATLAATGIGAPAAAVSAVVTKLIAAGFAAWLLWDLYQIWVEFSETAEARAQAATDDEKANASPATSTSPTADASPAPTSSPPAATPISSGDVLPPAASGSIDAILDKNPEQLTDGELRQLVEAQGRIEDPRGVTNNPGGILYGTGPLKDHQIGFKRANGDSSVKIAVYDTPENGIRAAMENWRNSRYYRGKSVRAGLGTWSGGNGAHYAKMLGSVRPGYDGTLNPQGETGSSMASSFADLGKGAMEAIGTVLRAGLGSNTMRPTSGSQLSGFNDTMSGNVERSSSDIPSAGGGGGGAATPVQGESAVTTALARTSAQIQNAVDLGNADAAQTATQQESTGASSIRQANASNDGKLECLDPNFPGSGAVEGYLQYHRLAA